MTDEVLENLTLIGYFEVTREKAANMLLSEIVPMIGRTGITREKTYKLYLVIT